MSDESSPTPTALCDRAPMREAMAVAGTSLVLGALFCLPLLRRLGVIGVRHDWDLSLDMDWIPYITVVHFHQLPLWNPYKCGGIPMLGNPQSRIVTPFFLLHLAVGAVIGLQLEVPLHFALAWAGGYVLGRVLKMSPVGAAGCATVFPASSWYWLHISEGHAMISLPLAWLPWAAALAIAAADRHAFRYAALAGAALALTFLEGNPYPTVYSALVLVCVLAVLTILRLSPWPLVALAATGAFAAAFAAPKLLPAYRILALHPRPIGNAGGNPFDLLIPFLFSRWQDLMRPSLDGWGFWECGAYIGLFALPAVLGAFNLRRSIPWIALVMGAAMMFRGDVGPDAYSLWAWLHRWPVFASMRLPSRAIIPMAFALSVLAGFGLDLIQRFGGRFGARLAVSILAVATIDCLVVSIGNLNYMFENQVAQVPVFSPNFRQNGFLALEHQLEINMRNEGAVKCYDYEDWTTPVLGYADPGYRGEQYLIGPGTVTLASWSPNELAFDVDVRGPSLLVVNQNFDSFWGVVQGAGEIVPEAFLTVRVPPGRQRIVLRYRDTAAMWGLGIFALAVIAGVGLWLMERRPVAGASS